MPTVVNFMSLVVENISRYIARRDSYEGNTPSMLLPPYLTMITARTVSKSRSSSDMSRKRRQLCWWSRTSRWEVRPLGCEVKYPESFQPPRLALPGKESGRHCARIWDTIVILCTASLSAGAPAIESYSTSYGIILPLYPKNYLG